MKNGATRFMASSTLPDADPAPVAGRPTLQAAEDSSAAADESRNERLDSFLVIVFTPPSVGL